MFFRVLGQVELEDDSGNPMSLRPKERRLLTVLLVDAGRVVSVDRVIDAVWGDTPASNPEAALQVHLSRVRKALPDPALLRSGTRGYQLVVEPGQLDAMLFEDRVREGEEAYHRGDRSRALGCLIAAEGLWRGPAYADFDGEEFSRPETTRLNQLRITASALRFECLLDGGTSGSAIPELEVLVATQPFNERFATQLARALYAEGRQQEALGILDRLRATLREELGVDPTPQTELVYEKILSHDPSLAIAAALPEAVATAGMTRGSVGRDPTNQQSQLDLGGSEHFTGDRRRRPRVAGLPTQLTSFVGRDRELAEVTELLRRGRVLSILGLGGVGKTRLALHVAAGMEGSWTEVWFVPLATHVDADLVPRAVARALGLSEDGYEPPRDALQTYFLDKSGFLVLDNCEHLVDSVGALIRDLVTTSPDLTVITTSRRPLSMPGEITYVLEPLDVSDAAVQLFMDRAEMAKPGFATDEATIRDICQRLDGLPLAIELAAARVRLLEPEEIARRLDQRFELLTGGSRLDPLRHATLRATFDWSYDLLSEEEQWAFRRLSVLPGGITDSSAEALLAGARSSLQTLLTLADQSLLQRRPGGFEMLQTVRDYAFEHLKAAAEDGEASRAQAHIFATLVEQAAERVRGASQLEWLDRLEMEHDNIRAALSWSLEHEPLLGAGMAADLGAFWFIRTYLAEGRKWLAQALSVEVDPALGARLHMALSKLAWEQYDSEEAFASSQRALSLARSSGDDALIGRALAMAARDLLDQRDYESASKMLHEAVGYLDDPRDRVFLADCYKWLGHVARYQSRMDEALAHHQRAKALFLAAGDLEGAGESSGAAGRDLFFMGDIEAAVPCLRDAIEMHRRLNNRVGVASGQVLVAQILALHPDLAGGAFEEAVSLYRDSLPLMLDVGDSWSIVQVLDGAVPLLVTLGHETEAARVWGAILSSCDELAVPEILRGSSPRIEEILEKALGPDYPAEVDSGRSTSITEATRMVLDRFEQVDQALASLRGTNPG